MNSFLFALFITISISAHTQTPNYSVSEEITLKKKEGLLSVVHADNTGVYAATHVVKLNAYFWGIPLGSNSYGSENLIKMNEKLEKIFATNFDKELNDKSFNQYFFNNNRLWLFATEYLKKEEAENLYCIEIDKNTGAIKGEWQLICTWAKYDKKQQFDIKITPNSDDTKYIVSNYLKDESTHQFNISIYDKNFKQQGKSVNLKNEFNPTYVTISDLLFTKTNHIVLCAKLYEDVPYKRKTKREFKENLVRVYDLKGKILHKIKVSHNNLFIHENKTIEINGILYMAASYGENRNSKATGTLVQLLNPETGQITVSSTQKLDTIALENTIAVTEDADEKKEIENEEKQKDTKDATSISALLLNKFSIDNDGSSYTFSEDKTVTDYFRYQSTTTVGPGGVRSTSTGSTRYTDINSKNIILTKLDINGNTTWRNIIPKHQIDSYLGSIYLSELEPLGNFQDSKSFMCRYSSFYSFQTKNKIYIVFNDNRKNENVIRKEQPIKRTYYFGKYSNTFIIEVDKATGTMVRNTVFNNKNLLPVVKGGKVFEKSVYFMSELHSLFSKSEYKIVKMTIY